MQQNDGVAAVERALSILDALTEEKSSLADLLRRTGFHKSTLLRQLNSLERCGYVLRTGDGLYRLGGKLLALAARYARHSPETGLAGAALGTRQEALMALCPAPSFH